MKYIEHRYIIAYICTSVPHNREIYARGRIFTWRVRKIKFNQNHKFALYGLPTRCDNSVRMNSFFFPPLDIHPNERTCHANRRIYKGRQPLENFFSQYFTRLEKLPYGKARCRCSDTPNLLPSITLLSFVKIYRIFQFD